MVDAHRGGHPDPVSSTKIDLRLAELLRPDGSLGREGTRALVDAARRAGEVAESAQVDDLLAFATSAVRDATDSAEVLDAVRSRAGVDLTVLPGEDEARLTFLAVRRWFGWSAGRLLCLDIGGGSLELATGMDEEPDVALSLPLGASRLTTAHLPGDPPSRAAVVELQKLVRDGVRAVVPRLLGAGTPDRAVGTSKTFRALARLAGAAPYSAGPRVPRTLKLTALDDVLPLLCDRTASERAKLPGVSPRRAGQLIAGAVVAREAMAALQVVELSICPWALREGVVLRRLDWLAGT